MSKEDLKELMRQTSFTIIKAEGNDRAPLHVYGKAPAEAVAGVLGQVMVDFANESMRNREAIYWMCRAFVDEHDGVEDSEGGLVSEE